MQATAVGYQSVDRWSVHTCKGRKEEAGEEARANWRGRCVKEEDDDDEGKEARRRKMEGGSSSALWARATSSLRVVRR